MRAERLCASGGESDAVPTPLELRLWEANVLSTSGVGDRTVRPSRGVWGAWLSLSGAAAVAAAVVLIVALQPFGDDELTTRGLDSPSLSVRAFCETVAADGTPRMQSLTAHPGPLEVAACPSTARVRFAYRSDAGGFIFVFARLGDDEPTQLVGPGEGGAWQVAAASDLSPLDVSLPPGFSSGHRRLTVFFVRTDDPHDPGEIAASLANAGEIDEASLCTRVIEFSGP
jgi:hypothetical protein